MDSPNPFEGVAGLVSEAHDELIATPMRLALAALEKHDVPFETDEDRRPLFDSIRSMRTEAELRSWLHLEAEIVDMEELNHSLQELYEFLRQARSDDLKALALMREVVQCPTVINLCRLAVRDFLL